MGMELPVWSGRVDVVFPFYATGELASETRPLDGESVEIEATVRYQACNDEVCFPPKTERLVLRLALDVVDVPALGTHSGHGQREGNYSATPHMARLLLRKLRQYPLGLPRFPVEVDPTRARGAPEAKARGGKLTARHAPAQRVAQQRQERCARPRSLERERRLPVRRDARVDERLPVRRRRVAVAERNVGDLAEADRQRVAERARLAVVEQRRIALVAEPEARLRIAGELRREQQPALARPGQLDEVELVLDLEARGQPLRERMIALDVDRIRRIGG
jgi:hypothetical protein